MSHAHYRKVTDLALKRSQTVINSTVYDDFQAETPNFRGISTIFIKSYLCANRGKQNRPFVKGKKSGELQSPIRKGPFRKSRGNLKVPFVKGIWGTPGKNDKSPKPTQSRTKRVKPDIVLTQSRPGSFTFQPSQMLRCLVHPAQLGYTEAMSTRRKRPQSPKSNPRGVANPAMAEGMRELRKGSRAQPHAMATDYRRRPKHAARGWNEE